MWFLSSCYFMIKHSKTLQSSDKRRFKNEKYWFWSFLALFPIMAFAWWSEFLVVVNFSGDPNSPTILVDFIKTYTAINIFVIFLNREDIKLLVFKNYHSFEPNAVAV